MNALPPRTVCMVAVVALVVGALGGLTLGPAPKREPAPVAEHATKALPTATRLTVPSNGSTKADAGREPEHPEDADLAGPLLAAVRQRDYFRRKHDLYEIGQGLDADGMRRAMEATERFPKYDRDWAQPTLMAQWFEVDPDGAFGWIEGLVSRDQQSTMWREFFHTGGLKDPATALRMLERYQSKGHGEDFAYSVFDGWAGFDPAAAVQGALALKGKEERTSALAVSLQRLADVDPERAFAQLNLLPNNLRLDQLPAVLTAWAKRDPQAAMQQIMAIPEARARQQALAQTIGNLAESNPEQAGVLLDQLPAGRLRNTVIEQMVQRISYRNPQAAAEYVMELPLRQQRSAARSVAYQFAREDVPNALAWAEGLSGETRKGSVNAIVSIWAESAPQAAAEYCLKNAPTNRQALVDVVSKWAENDAPSALAWAKALPAGEAREDALTRGVAQIASSNPQQAIASVETMLSPAKHQEAFRMIASTWAAQDPQAAAAWASQMPNADARRETVSQITSIWAREDPAATAGWLDQFPAGDLRDSTVNAFVQAVGDSDAAGAVAWAATIANSGMREGAIRNALYQWHQEDPNAARAWVRQTGALSEPQRKQILQGFP